MSTTVLTDEQITRILEENRPEYDGPDKAIEVSRAIEQAVLQSPEIQALRKDAERYRWLRKHWFTMTACYDGGRVEFATRQPRYSSATEDNVDEAIDHARRAEGDT